MHRLRGGGGGGGEGDLGGGGGGDMSSLGDGIDGGGDMKGSIGGGGGEASGNNGTRQSGRLKMMHTSLEISCAVGPPSDGFCRAQSIIPEPPTPLTKVERSTTSAFVSE